MQAIDNSARASEGASGLLTRVLADYSPETAGYHLYFSSRRQKSPALGVLVGAIRLQSSSLMPKFAPGRENRFENQELTGFGEVDRDTATRR